MTRRRPREQPRGRGDSGRAVPGDAGIDFRFWSATRPYPKGSLEHIGRGNLRESNPMSKPHLDRMHLEMNVARGRHPRRADLPIRGPVEVQLDFFFLWPDGALETDRPSTIDTGDLDKLTRLVLDALTKAKIIQDDARVVSLRVDSWYDRSTGTLVRVQPARDGTGARPMPGLF